LPRRKKDTRKNQPVDSGSVHRYNLELPGYLWNQILAAKERGTVRAFILHGCDLALAEAEKK